MGTKKIKANFLIKPGRKGKFNLTEDNELPPFGVNKTQRGHGEVTPSH